MAKKVKEECKFFLANLKKKKVKNSPFVYELKDKSGRKYARIYELTKTIKYEECEGYYLDIIRELFFDYEEV